MKMETLDWYLKNAENAIRKFAKGTKLIKNEDAIAFVARFMMDADSRYDEKTGTREGFRWKYAEYAVKSFINRDRKKRKMLSINATFKNSTYDSRGSSLEKILTKDIIPHNSNNSAIPDVIQLINNAPYLNDRERNCILAKFVDSKNYQEIGDSLGITRERVRQIIDKAIYKVRKNCGCSS